MKHEFENVCPDMKLDVDSLYYFCGQTYQILEIIRSELSKDSEDIYDMILRSGMNIYYLENNGNNKVMYEPSDFNQSNLSKRHIEIFKIINRYIRDISIERILEI